MQKIRKMSPHFSISKKKNLSPQSNQHHLLFFHTTTNFAKSLPTSSHEKHHMQKSTKPNQTPNISKSCWYGIGKESN